jgi:WD40 repeat protein
VGGADGLIYSLDQRQLTRDFCCGKHDDIVCCIAANELAQLTSIGMDSKLKVWSTKPFAMEDRLQCHTLIEYNPERFLLKCCWGPNHTVVVGNCAGDVTMFDSVSGLKVFQRKRLHSAVVTSIAHLRGNSSAWVLSGSMDKTVVAQAV